MPYYKNHSLPPIKESKTILRFIILYNLETISPVKDTHQYATCIETTSFVISCAKRLCLIQTNWLEKCTLMWMTRLPSVKRALKPLCWLVALDCSRMYIRFLEDVIGGGCCVPQSFLRRCASLLGPSNTCYERSIKVFGFNRSNEKTSISFPLLRFIQFDCVTALVWAVQTNCALPILRLWPFPKNACIQDEDPVAFITKMHQVTIFLCMYLV